MDCAQAVDLTAWGDQTCSLKLPGFSICLSGLSVSQRDQILSDYADFAIGKEASLCSELILHCEAYRLESELERPLGELEKEGQYAPEKQRHDNLIEITGFNFLASFSDGSNGDFLARLGVANEQEFALPLVLENFLRIYSAHNALNLSGAILHSAGLVFDDQAYVFVGYSGVGKTTLTRKAHQYGATVLSDDLNLVLPTSDGVGFEAFKVPFTGEFGRTVDHADTASSFPVKAIVLLEQAERISVELVRSSVAISRLLAGSPFVNNDETEIAALFDVYNTLVDRVPVLKLALPLQATIDDILKSINQLIDAK